MLRVKLKNGQVIKTKALSFSKKNGKRMCWYLRGAGVIGIPAKQIQNIVSV